MTTEPDVLLEVAGLGNLLRVRLGAPCAPNAADLDARSWRHAHIEVSASPFSGVIDTVFTPEDVAEWRAAGEAVSARRQVTVGGHRSPEVTITPDEGVDEVAVTPNGDDPWPLLRFLVFHDA